MVESKKESIVVAGYARVDITYYLIMPIGYTGRNVGMVKRLICQMPEPIRKDFVKIKTKSLFFRSDPISYGTST